ncbi:MAG: hypothetical protein WC390_07390 [Sulfurimonas sp.]
MKKPKPKTNFGDKQNTAGLDKHPENINKNGRPKDFLTALLKEKIDSENNKIIITGEKVEQSEITGKWNKTGEQVTIEVLMPTKEMIITALLKKAAKQDLKAIDMIFDRVEGKPKQQTEITGKDGKDLIPPTITQIEIIKTTK